MARTRKGAKGIGFEFSRRKEGKRGWRDACAFTKRVGVRAERRIGRLTIDDAKERAAYCPHCHGEGCPRCLAE